MLEVSQSFFSLLQKNVLNRQTWDSGCRPACSPGALEVRKPAVTRDASSKHHRGHQGRSAEGCDVMAVDSRTGRESRAERFAAASGLPGNGCLEEGLWRGRRDVAATVGAAIAAREWVAAIEDTTGESATRIRDFDDVVTHVHSAVAAARVCVLPPMPPDVEVIRLIRLLPSTRQRPY
jgi:hypothetical protein